MKRGHWEIKFKFWVEGRDDVFDLEDLSEISQEHIIDSIKQGYTSGVLNEVDCFDLCDILRIHLTTYYEHPINVHVMNDGSGDFYGCICSN